MTNNEKARIYRAEHPAQREATLERHYIKKLTALGFIVTRAAGGVTE